MAVLGQRFHVGGALPLSVPAVGVAVRCIDRNNGQLHAGVFLVGADGASALIHLAWHYDLRRTETLAPYSLAEVRQPHSLWSRRAQAIANFAEQVFEHHGTGGLPYSFTRHASFDRSARFLPEQGGAPGFTCATFAMAVFAAAGVPLMCDEGWPRPAPDDVAWQAFIALHLCQDDPQHAADLNDYAGEAARYRPEQVACAAASDHHPVAYEDVREVADCVAWMLRAAS